MNAVERALQRAALAAWSVSTRMGLVELPKVRRLYSTFYFLYKGYVEARFIDTLLERVPAGSVVVDVGAYIGFFAVSFARKVGPSGRVVAFEPEPGNAALLRRNVQRAGVENVTVVEAAISDRRGFAALYLEPGHPAGHRIFASTSARRSISIPVLTLDEYFVGVPLMTPLSLAKIDVQGTELKVLRGMQRTLERFPAMRLLVEYTPSALAEAGDSSEEFVEFFRSAGYRPLVFEESRRMFTPVTFEALSSIRGHEAYVDVLFERRPEATA